MSSKFEVSEVHLSETEEYVVVVKLSEGKVRARFEVSLTPRRKRHGHRIKEHHKKSLEALQHEASQSIGRFCQEVSDSIGGGEASN